MDALHERADSLRMKLGPMVAEAQSLELALIAAMPETAAMARSRDLANGLTLAAHHAQMLIDLIGEEIDRHLDAAESAADEVCAEVSISPLVRECAKLEDEAMRSASVTRRNEAAGARESAVIIETRKRLPDELKPWWCSAQTVEAHRAGLRRRGIDVEALEQSA